jgi:6-pyruvoyltetrahydropterin/6-carboxytetrahydropterin synthase
MVHLRSQVIATGAIPKECGVEIFKEFKFEAAHRLDHLPAGHKCRNLHGHSYRLRVYVRGKIDRPTGWVMDFDDIRKACKPLVDMLDHSYLNEIEGMGISTSEGICRWLWTRLKPQIPGLARVELWETATSGASYAGEDE